MEINTKEPEYTRVSTYTNVLIIEYSRIDNKKPSIIGSLRYNCTLKQELNRARVANACAFVSPRKRMALGS